MLTLITTSEEKIIQIFDYNALTSESSGKTQLSSIFDKTLNPTSDLSYVKMKFQYAESINLPKITIFSDNLNLSLTKNMIANCTLISNTHVNKNEAWIEIKEIFLKHFLPDQYSRLDAIGKKVKQQKATIIDLEKQFENMLLQCDLKSIKENSEQA